MTRASLRSPSAWRCRARNVHLRDSEPLGDLGLREADVELHVDYGLLSLGQAREGLAEVDVVPEFLEPEGPSAPMKSMTVEMSLVPFPSYSASSERGLP